MNADWATVLPVQGVELSSHSERPHSPPEAGKGEEGLAETAEEWSSGKLQSPQTLRSSKAKCAH